MQEIDFISIQLETRWIESIQRKQYILVAKSESYSRLITTSLKTGPNGFEWE